MPIREHPPHAVQRVQDYKKGTLWAFSTQRTSSIRADFRFRFFFTPDRRRRPRKAVSTNYGSVYGSRNRKNLSRQFLRRSRFCAAQSAPAHQRQRDRGAIARFGGWYYRGVLEVLLWRVGWPEAPAEGLNFKAFFISSKMPVNQRLFQNLSGARVSFPTSPKPLIYRTGRPSNEIRQN